jgi:ATP-binding cassette subfamily B protein/subfamily B ATP-binding cassette protein MsbA
MKRLWWFKLGRYARAQWPGLLLAMGCMALAVGLEVLRPWPLKLLVDHAFEGQPLPAGMAWLALLPGAGSRTGLLAWLTAGTVVLFLGGWLGRMAQQYVQAGVGARMVYGLSADLFRHLQRLSLRFHNRQRAGDLVKRVTTDTNCVRELFFSVFVPMVAAMLTLAGMFGVLWKLEPRLALMAMLVAPVLGLCIWRFAAPMSERSEAYYASQADVMSAAEQTLTALPAVWAFRQEAREQERFEASWRDSDGAYLRMTAAQLRFKCTTGAVTAVGTAAVLAAGGFQVLSGEIGLGSLVVFLSYLASLYAPLETLAYLAASWSAAGASARRVFDVFDETAEVRERPRARVLATRSRAGSGRVRFERVSFGYDPERPVLRGIDLEAQPGETIALVGPTGAGKSTLVSLIPRLFDPWDGCVTLDGVDVREVQLASLRARVSMVLQEPFLLPLTIAENIAYGSPGASRATIVEAAVAAHADGFIRALPGGYDAMLGERGATLSGGQRQRLAIARALLKDAPVLILDEPTSALDAQTEALLLQALERLTAGRTTFVIAHRLSTVRQATRIVVLEDGRITQQGTHDELRQRAGTYRRLCQVQFGEVA